MTREEAIQVIEDNRPTSGYQMLCEALDLAVKALREQEDRRWIPVTERLPNPQDRAICINKDGDMMIGTYTEWGWMFPCYFKKPTNWMQLPQPPKEDA